VPTQNGKPLSDPVTLLREWLARCEWSSLPSTDLFVDDGFILSEERWTTVRIALARKLTNSTSLHERCPWHRFCRRSDQVFWSTPLLTKKQVRSKHWIRILWNVEPRKHSIGNIEKRVSICFQQNCFWTINLDRKMGQQKNQAAL